MFIFGTKAQSTHRRCHLSLILLRMNCIPHRHPPWRCAAAGAERADGSKDKTLHTTFFGRQVRRWLEEIVVISIGITGRRFVWGGAVQFQQGFFLLELFA
jgi:hypothetical protein